MVDQIAGFGHEYTIQIDPAGRVMFESGQLGFGSMTLRPNAVVYERVPVTAVADNRILAEITVTLWEVDSSRDYAANHYGLLVSKGSLSEERATWGAVPYVKSGSSWEIERSTISGEDQFVISGFVPTEESFMMVSPGWRTYRTSKNASLVEIILERGNARYAHTPKLALPYYKLQQAYSNFLQDEQTSDEKLVRSLPSLLVSLPNIKPALFGTSGVRGKLGYDIDEDIILATSQAIVEHILSSDMRGPIVIGCDTRFSSEDFARTAAEVFAAHADAINPRQHSPQVIFMNIPLLETDPQATSGEYYKRDAAGTVSVIHKPFVPTPLMTFAIRSLDPPAVAGVTMTASHNYGTDNGYKSLRGLKGGIAQEQVTNKLQRRANEILARGELVQRYDFEQGIKDGLIERRDLRTAYFEHIESLLPHHADGPSGFDVIRASRPQVAVDLLYGTGNGFLDEILETISQNHWPIIARKFHYWRDPSFGGGRPDCEDPNNIREMIAFVQSHHDSVDVGLSVDSDSDRFGIVDGRIPNGLINANHIIAMQLYYRNRVCGLGEPVCRTVVTSHMLDAMAKAYGLKLLALPRIGFKWIGDRMNDEGMSFVVCGEESSGLSIGDFPEKDGILADILTLEMMCKLGQLESHSGLQQRPVKPLQEILGSLQQEFGAWHFHRHDLYGIHNKQKVMDYFRYFYRPNMIDGLEMENVEIIRKMFSFYAPDDPNRISEENRARLRDPKGPLSNENVIDGADNPLVGDGVKYYLKLRAADYDRDPFGAKWRGDGIVGASVHIRESGNEPVIRVYVQHRTDDAVRQRIEDQIVAEIVRIDNA